MADAVTRKPLHSAPNPPATLEHHASSASSATAKKSLYIKATSIKPQCPSSKTPKSARTTFATPSCTSSSTKPPSSVARYSPLATTATTTTAPLPHHQMAATTTELQHAAAAAAPSPFSHLIRQTLHRTANASVHLSNESPFRNLYCQCKHHLVVQQACEAVAVEVAAAAAAAATSPSTESGDCGSCSSSPAGCNGQKAHAQ